MKYQFGNDPKKVDSYRKFWNRENVQRPMVGFTFKGWFPLTEYRASAAWPQDSYLTAGMIDPNDFMDDQEKLLSEADVIDDDILRGAQPTNSVFWCCGALGARMRIMPGNVVPEDRSLSWGEADKLWEKPEASPWWRKYMDYLDVLSKRSAGRFPISIASVLGPLDYAVNIRGHEQTVIDMMTEPENAARLLDRGADFFIKITKAAWDRIPRYEGGYFEAQYQLWAPGPIARLQEDALAVMSPDLYRRFIRPVDEKIAKEFECSFMHLHSTSMFVLDDILEIQALRCLQINNDVAGPPLTKMLEYFRKVQDSGRSLLIRGSFSPDELKLLADSLDPRGLYINVMVKDRAEVDRLRPAAGM